MCGGSWGSGALPRKSLELFQVISSIFFNIFVPVKVFCPYLGKVAGESLEKFSDFSII